MRGSPGTLPASACRLWKRLKFAIAQPIAYTTRTDAAGENSQSPRAWACRLQQVIEQSEGSSCIRRVRVLIHTSAAAAPACRGPCRASSPSAGNK